MKKIGKPTGLVRYDSQRSFGGEKRRSLLRPRVFVYALLGLLGLTVAGLSVRSRADFHVNALRAAGMPYVIEGERIRNLYTVRVQNKSDHGNTYSVRLEEGPADIEMIMPQPELRLRSLEDGRSPVFFYLGRSQYTEPFPLTLSVTDSISGTTRLLEVLFRGP